MKKWLLVFIIATLLSVAVVVPPSSEAASSKLTKIKKELNALKKKKNEAKKRAEETQQQLRRVQNQKATEEQDMKTLVREMEQSKTRLTELQKQIRIIDSDLEEAITKLEEAQEYVYQRNALLESRLRLMYTNGTVSYLEVLLDAADFSDFLDRYAQLTALADQDRQLLLESQRDRDEMEKQKNRIERQITDLRNKYFEVEGLTQSLKAQEEQKKKLIASLMAQEERLEEITEDQEQTLLQIIRRESELIRQQQREQNVKPPPEYKGGKFAWPVPSVKRVSSYFGMRMHPIKKTRKMHKGIDIGAPGGATIVAAESGVVVVASWNNGYGNTVVIDHGKNVQTWYAHIRNGGTKVGRGQHVTRGQKIAEVGTTGLSTGNHLHFEVRVGGVAKNPLDYLR
jgi:murein DD-endopeptidase MepM/ murein hydrolase activator NlpD